MTFVEKLEAIVDENNSLLCVNLDPDLSKMPPHMASHENPLLDFCKEIVNSTYDLVCAYKPNSAFFEAHGAHGVQQLKDLCHYIRTTYPHTVLILDAKRGDIGNTMEAYGSYAFEYLGADALTINPYLGREAVGSLLNAPDRGCIVLCRTSNPGAHEFQDVSIDGMALYMMVAREVTSKWNVAGNCMLVVGATYVEELADVRRVAQSMWFLVPGIGAQGGDLEATMKAGLREDKRGLVICVGRSLLYADTSEQFTRVVRSEAQKLKAQINTLREK